MKSRVLDKQKAIALRKSGASYKEIMNEVKVGKGTLSGWLKYVEYSSKELARISKNAQRSQDNGRSKAVLSNRSKRIERQRFAKEEANRIFEIHKNDPFFHYGIVMYWAEGAKKSNLFQFMNSDPDVIVLMLAWLKKYLKIDENTVYIRLFIHRVYSEENCENYWSEVTGKPLRHFKKTVYKPTIHNFKKNPEYKGCARIEVMPISVYRIVINLKEMLADYLKNANLEST